VAWERKYRGEPKSGGGYLQRRAKGLSRDKGYAVNENGQMFMVISDGRAGYTGPLDLLERTVTQAIAAGHVTINMRCSAYLGLPSQSDPWQYS
jgi:hypothetical protein